MRNVFDQGDFREYRVASIEGALQPVRETYEYGRRKTTIFLSHKHDELDELKDIIGFLEKNYQTKVYIDSEDPSMPNITSGITATRIKDKIEKCDKFILLATNGAIESKWCNWELGYGDSKKYKKNIALFPIKEKSQQAGQYKGSEYMSIYPHICYYSGWERYKSGAYVKKGFYIRVEGDDGSITIEPLEEWLCRY